MARPTKLQSQSNNIDSCQLITYRASFYDLADTRVLTSDKFPTISFSCSVRRAQTPVKTVLSLVSL